MSLNVWYADNTYNVHYNGKRYQRRSYVAAKELIESLIAGMVLAVQDNQRREGK